MTSQKTMLRKILPLLQEKGKRYRKQTNVLARRAAGKELVVTRPSSGEETRNYATRGDYIVTNLTGAKEQYVVAKDKFEARYQLVQHRANGLAEYASKGQVMGIEVTAEIVALFSTGNDFNFEAPWGGNLIVKKGDFLAVPPTLDEIYRIAKVEFKETYLEVPM
ncbi:MAG: hypothetical protein AAF798_18990 [Bacteroidota bacterium]